MREMFERMWNQIKDWIAAMPKNRKIQLSVLTIVVVTLAIVLVSWMSRTVWVPITNDPNNASQVYSALMDMNFPVDVSRTNVNEILVPQQRLGEAVNRLREQNILTVTGFDRSIMEDAAGFGVTDNHANQLYDMQRGDHIATTLMSSPRIQHAFVIVSLGETSPFRIATNVRSAAAMVQVTVVNNDRLTQFEVNTIFDLVRASVPGIDTENISLSDSNLNGYTVGDAQPGIDEVHGTRIAIQNRLIEQMKIRTEMLFEPIFGMQNLRIQPHVLLNWDDIHTEKIEYFPPIPGELEGILRSRERIHELSRRWLDAEGIPGTDSNDMGMGAPEYPWGDIDENDMYRRFVERTNAEINQTITMIDHEQGVIQDMGISVLINSNIEMDEDYTNELIDAVSKSTGVPINKISLSMIPFVHGEAAIADAQARMESELAARRTREMFETILQYSVILLLGLMVMLLIRTVVKAVKPPPEPEPVLIAAGIDGIDYLIDDDDDFESGAKEYEDVELNQKSAGLEQIERFIDKDSASVAQLLRNWLSDE